MAKIDSTASDYRQLPPEIEALVNERETARKNKDWKLADKIRETIKKKGYIVKDADYGPQVTPVPE
ncbi:hypothetical protein KW787_03260 [Candidatus Pacearchaeota archaeon]|nr:hypothetical protein [Candidatus Pacearchaeota archaeon]